MQQESKNISPDTLTTIEIRKTSTMWSNHNLLQKYYKILTRKFVFEHVRGHQDTVCNNNNNNLNLQAKLNILMDKRAALAHSDPTIMTEETTTRTIEIHGKILTGRRTCSL